jgi:hypothetical protein
VLLSGIVSSDTIFEDAIFPAECPRSGFFSTCVNFFSGLR